MAKDAKGHGSDKHGSRTLEGHPYHLKSNAELYGIARDAKLAAEATRGMTQYDPGSNKRQDTEGKYLDQMNDALSVLGHRTRGGADLSHDARRAEGLDRAAGVGRHNYNAESVNAAIASNNRHGPKIGGKEAKLIHRLMRGRG